MDSFRTFREPNPKSRKLFLLPPWLDMGTVKLEDFDFDVAREAARLRAQGATAKPPEP